MTIQVSHAVYHLLVSFPEGTGFVMDGEGNLSATEAAPPVLEILKAHLSRKTQVPVGEVVTMPASVLQEMHDYMVQLCKQNVNLKNQVAELQGRKEHVADADVPSRAKGSTVLTWRQLALAMFARFDLQVVKCWVEKKKTPAKATLSSIMQALDYMEPESVEKNNPRKVSKYTRRMETCEAPRQRAMAPLADMCESYLHTYDLGGGANVSGTEVVKKWVRDASRSHRDALCARCTPILFPTGTRDEYVAVLHEACDGKMKDHEQYPDLFSQMLNTYRWVWEEKSVEATKKQQKNKDRAEGAVKEAHSCPFSPQYVHTDSLSSSFWTTWSPWTSNSVVTHLQETTRDMISDRSLMGCVSFAAEISPSNDSAWPDLDSCCMQIQS